MSETVSTRPPTPACEVDGDGSFPRLRKVSVVRVGGRYRVEKFLIDMLRDIAKCVSGEP